MPRSKPGALPLGDTPTTDLQIDKWCGTRDLNPHTSRRQNLNLVRLPISPVPQMVATARFELATPTLWVLCSNQLSYVAILRHHIGFARRIMLILTNLVKYFFAKKSCFLFFCLQIQHFAKKTIVFSCTKLTASFHFCLKLGKHWCYIWQHTFP